MLDKRPQFGWLVASVRKIKIEARKLGQEYLQQRNQFPAGDIAYALCETGMMGVHRRVTPAQSAASADAVLDVQRNFPQQPGQVFLQFGEALVGLACGLVHIHRPANLDLQAVAMLGGWAELGRAEEGRVGEECSLRLRVR